MERASRLVELIISRVLRGGVVASLAVILVGVVASFVRHPAYVSSRDELTRVTSRDSGFPHTPSQVWTALLEGRGQAIVVIGLMLLLLTPILRVAISIIAFAVEKDLTFVVITSAVLLFLLLSFAVGGAS
jgi:uncharacterized membrane protein